MRKEWNAHCDGMNHDEWDRWLIAKMKRNLSLTFCDRSSKTVSIRKISLVYLLMTWQCSWHTTTRAVWDDKSPSLFRLIKNRCRHSWSKAAFVCLINWSYFFRDSSYYLPLPSVIGFSCFWTVDEKCSAQNCKRRIFGLFSSHVQSSQHCWCSE